VTPAFGPNSDVAHMPPPGEPRRNDGDQKHVAIIPCPDINVLLRFGPSGTVGKKPNGP
jgi:hypothetical protein